MKRPLVALLVFFLLGILAGRYLAWGSLILSCFFGLVLLLCLLLYLNYKHKFIFIFFAFTVLAVFLTKYSFAYKNPALENFVLSEQYTSIEAVVNETRLSSDESRQIVILKPINSPYVKIQAILKKGEIVEFGQKITVEGKLEHFSKSRIPGGFDQYMYYRTRNIDYQMFPEIVLKNGYEKSFKLILNSFRQKLSDIYEKSLPESEAGIVKAMVMGDKYSVDSQISDLYRKAGIYHIICISGLHISIIAVALSKVLRLYFSRKLSAALALGFLILYCVFTGSSVSTVRAVVMFGVTAFGIIINRRRDLTTSISFAALCLLIYQPLYLWDAGFQYSFSAVYGISLCQKPMETALQSRLSKLNKNKILINSLGAFSASTAAWVGTMPFTITKCYYIQPFSIVLNMLVLPTAALTAISSFISGLAGLFSQNASVFISGIPFVMLKFYEKMCDVFTKIPLSLIYTGYKPITFIISWYILVLLVFLGLRNKKHIKYLYMFFICLLLITVINNVMAKSFQVVMLDVGQGDSFVIGNKKTTFVIDGGGSAQKEFGKNTGATVLIPYLRYSGIKKVDGIFVTHTDIDHSGGIIELLDEIKADKLFLSAAVDETDNLYKLLSEKARKNGAQIIKLKEGDFYSKNGISFKCIYPFNDTIENDVNNTSLVLKAEYANTSFLFTGDIDTKVQSSIFLDGEMVKADVFKLAHHGSKHSFSLPFFDEVNAKAVIVSTSKNNSFGHPALEVIDYFDKKAIPVYNTAVTGAIILEPHGNKLKVTKWSETP